MKANVVHFFMCFKWLLLLLFLALTNKLALHFNSNERELFDFIRLSINDFNGFRALSFSFCFIFVVFDLFSLSLSDFSFKLCLYASVGNIHQYYFSSDFHFVRYAMKENIICRRNVKYIYIQTSTWIFTLFILFSS